MTLYDRLQGIHKIELEKIKYQYPTTYVSLKDTLKSTYKIDDLDLKSAHDLYLFCGVAANIKGIYEAFEKQEVSQVKS